MAQEVMESTLRGAVVVRLCRCLEDCAAAPNTSGAAAWCFAGFTGCLLPGHCCSIFVSHSSDGKGGFG